MRRKRVERRGIGDFPTVERRPLVLVGMNDDALLAIVHAQRERAAALVDHLHAEKARAIEMCIRDSPTPPPTPPPP